METSTQAKIAVGIDSVIYPWLGTAPLPFNQRVTWPSNGRYPDTSFDHFFVWGLGRSKTELLKMDGVSDHRPVVLNFAH